MSFNTVGSPGSASYSGAGPINWAQLLNGVGQQPAQQQGMGNNQNSLGAAIMQWLQQQQKQAQATTPPTTNVASNFSPNTSGGGVY